MAKGRRKKITRARRGDNPPSGKSRYAMKGGPYKYSFATGEALLEQKNREERRGGLKANVEVNSRFAARPNW